MRVLVACEESQAVCKAFRQLGHEAYSCDLQECTGGHPEWHIRVDALELLKMKWAILIAFPPCTYMTKAGAVRMRRGGGAARGPLSKGHGCKEVFYGVLQRGRSKDCH